MRTAVALLVTLWTVPATAQSHLPAGFVLLKSIDPSIAQDIRYAGSNNLLGRPLAGYEDAACILRIEAAQALARVQADLKPTGLGLKVYDCYRPIRAVRMMAAWTQDGRSDGKHFYPRVEKRNLLNGYISGRSLHSTGIAVDLSLVRIGASLAADAGRRGDCNAPDRSADEALDMGTSFDCLDPDSHTQARNMTPEQRHNRAMLLNAMRKHGFRNYAREWWHFSFGAAPADFHDFPVRAR